jgi:hypothetical protein
VKTNAPPTVTGNLPVPDPTVLTQQAVDRATAVYDGKLAAFRDVVEVRLSGMDRATELVARDIAAIPGMISTSVGHLRELYEVKFEGIAQQLVERDVRAAGLQQAGTDALAAAFRAAKELGIAQNEAGAQANAKTEVAVGQQIKALTDKIDVINGRLDRGEAFGQGGQVAKTERRLDTGQVVSYAVAAIALLGLVASLVGLVVSLVAR